MAVFGGSTRYWTLLALVGFFGLPSAFAEGRACRPSEFRGQGRGGLRLRLRLSLRRENPTTPPKNEDEDEDDALPPPITPVQTVNPLGAL